ncbi:MAG TPA: hypothetical protein VGV85_14395 [Longimicrobiaceae bacterium]|nr:hypothetical protein [Longimicrobiaceae bacterium]
MRTRRLAAAGALAVVLAACTALPSGQEPEERRVGIIRLYQTDPPGVLVVPDTVRAGVDFQVAATTLGGGCERAGETEVAVSGGLATLTPYDYTRRAEACADILRHLPHTATLRFASPGQAVVLLQGRRVGADTPQGGVSVTIEKRVVVR